MNDTENTIQFLPDRLNQEPVIFKGLTNTELFKTLGIGFLGWCPLCVFIFSFFGIAILGIGLAIMMTAITLWVVASKLQTVKRNLPDGQHTVIFNRWLQKKGIKNAGYCLYTGRWDTKRQEK